MFIKYEGTDGNELYFALKDKVASFNPPDGTNTRISYKDESIGGIMSMQPQGGPIIYQGFDMDTIFKTGTKKTVKDIVRQEDWSFNIIIE